MKTKDAVDFFGSKAKLAKACGIANSAVSQWGDDVPTTQSYKIEIMSGGVLTACKQIKRSKVI